MTRRDYVLIAAAIRQVVSENDEQMVIEGISRTAEEIAEQLFIENPRFERGRFLTACGLGT